MLKVTFENGAVELHETVKTAVARAEETERTIAQVVNTITPLIILYTTNITEKWEGSYETLEELEAA